MKMPCILAGITMLITSAASADTFLGVYIGGQGWNMDASGSFADQTTFTGSAQPADFNFSEKTQGSVYVALEHFVPLVPNVKLYYSQMDTDGNTQLSDSFTFGGQLYTAQSTVFTEADITSTDIILYYELFDNALFSFDLGLNGKVLNGDFIVLDQASNTQSMESFSGVVPTAYSKIQFGFPFSGLGAYAEGSFLSIGDHTLNDYQVAVTYSFIESLALDMTVQAGYRDVTADVDDLDGITTDLSFDGVFLGLELHF